MLKALKRILFEFECMYPIKRRSVQRLKRHNEQASRQKSKRATAITKKMKS